MKEIYRIVFATLAISLTLTGCYEDKGNYVYSEIEEITFVFGTDDEGTPITSPSLAAMRGNEYIEVDPTIYSSLTGEIKENDPNYEFGCKINYSPSPDQRWLDIDTLGTKAVKFFATIPAGDYQLWYTVKNKTTGVTRSAIGTVKIITPTFEGWMVLSNNGNDNHVRLDMIYADSKGEEQVSIGIFEDKVPPIYDAVSMVMNPTRKSVGDQIYLLSQSGGYQLDATYLQTTLANNIKVIDFMMQNAPGEVIAWSGIFNNYAGGNQGQVCVTTEGNAYAVHVFGANAGFEYPMNTNKVGDEPTYKVAPMIGTAQDRPGNSNCALFYDITNKRFMGYDYSLDGVSTRLLFTLNDPSDRLFSFNTGMDLIDMESTKFSQGLVYSVLQDTGGKRHIYAINMAGAKVNNCFVQENAYDNIDAPDFNTATDYAFHSQFPFMFYCQGNKVYAYNLAIGRVTDTLTLGPDETVTKIKFNLFQADPTWFADPSQAFLSKQYDLIVASTTGGENSGIVRFYDIDVSGKMTIKSEFTGLGEHIVDVTYRERKG